MAVTKPDMYAQVTPTDPNALMANNPATPLNFSPVFQGGQMANQVHQYDLSRKLQQEQLELQKLQSERQMIMGTASLQVRKKEIEMRQKALEAQQKARQLQSLKYLNDAVNNVDEFLGGIKGLAATDRNYVSQKRKEFADFQNSLFGSNDYEDQMAMTMRYANQLKSDPKLLGVLRRDNMMLRLAEIGKTTGMDGASVMSEFQKFSDPKVVEQNGWDTKAFESELSKSLTKDYSTFDFKTFDTGVDELFTRTEMPGQEVEDLGLGKSGVKNTELIASPTAIEGQLRNMFKVNPKAAQYIERVYGDVDTYIQSKMAGYPITAQPISGYEESSYWALNGELSNVGNIPEGVKGTSRGNGSSSDLNDQVIHNRTQGVSTTTNKDGTQKTAVLDEPDVLELKGSFMDATVPLNTPYLGSEVEDYTYDTAAEKVTNEPYKIKDKFTGIMAHLSKFKQKNPNTGMDMPIVEYNKDQQMFVMRSDVDFSQPIVNDNGVLVNDVISREVRIAEELRNKYTHALEDRKIVDKKVEQEFNNRFNGKGKRIIMSKQGKRMTEDELLEHWVESKGGRDYLDGLEEKVRNLRKKKDSQLTQNALNYGATRVDTDTGILGEYTDDLVKWNKYQKDPSQVIYESDIVDPKEVKIQREIDKKKDEFAKLQFMDRLEEGVFHQANEKDQDMQGVQQLLNDSDVEYLKQYKGFNMKGDPLDDDSYNIIAENGAVITGYRMHRGKYYTKIKTGSGDAQFAYMYIPEIDKMMYNTVYLKGLGNKDGYEESEVRHIQRIMQDYGNKSDYYKNTAIYYPGSLSASKVTVRPVQLNGTLQFDVTHTSPISGTEQTLRYENFNKLGEGLYKIAKNKPSEARIKKLVGDNSMIYHSIMAGESSGGVDTYNPDNPNAVGVFQIDAEVHAPTIKKYLGISVDDFKKDEEAQKKYTNYLIMNSKYYLRGDAAKGVESLRSIARKYGQADKYDDIQLLLMQHNRSAGGHPKAVIDYLKTGKLTPEAQREIDNLIEKSNKWRAKHDPLFNPQTNRMYRLNLSMKPNSKDKRETLDNISYDMNRFLVGLREFGKDVEGLAKSGFNTPNIMITSTTGYLYDPNDPDKHSHRKGSWHEYGEAVDIRLKDHDGDMSGHYGRKLLEWFGTDEGVSYLKKMGYTYKEEGRGTKGWHLHIAPIAGSVDKAGLPMQH